MTGNPLQKALIGLMPMMPRSLIWQFSRHYIAGTELADAYRAVAERLRARLVETGHPLRLYVSFGRLWYNYSMRRLRENPGMVGHIVKNFVTR